MKRFGGLLRRFRSDERGAFLVIFGIMAIVLVAASGAVVDFTAIEQAKARAQQALDSAALGLQPTIYNSPTPTAASLRTKAQALLTERLDDRGLTASVDQVSLNTSSGTLHLEASVVVPTAFVQLIGIDDVKARIVSEATRKQLNLEVAMVLDNSGSMASYNRMTNLKKAARSATDIMFSDEDSQPNVYVGIVPFTEFVNVGTGYKSASWMDRRGVSKVARDNFDDDDDHTNAMKSDVDRIGLFDQMGVAWGGCVEARNHVKGSNGHYYDTSDIPPDSSVPDSLFVPALAPDEPDTKSGRGYSGYANNYLSDTPDACTANYGSCTVVETQTGCSKNAKNCNTDTFTASYLRPDGATTHGSNVCSCSKVPAGNGATEINNVTSNTDSSGRNNNRTYVTTTTCNYGKSTTLADRELQERLCKYNGAKVSTYSVDGPNADCPATSLLPLTNQRSTVKSRISAMVADGGTNIHQGVIWGYRMLTPSEPLTEAKDFDTAVAKVMIVMTDGENTHSYSSNMNGADWYTAYGYPYNGRLTGNSTSALEAEMNNRTVTSCANAKAKGIVIYTIGLSSPNKTTTDMLTSCASSAKKAYFPNDPDDLDDVFTDIATQLANLRLAK